MAVRWVAAERRAGSIVAGPGLIGCAKAPTLSSRLSTTVGPEGPQYGRHIIESVVVSSHEIATRSPETRRRFTLSRRLPARRSHVPGRVRGR